MKMKSDTPYRTRPAGERRRERLAFEAILADAVRPETVVDTFAGVGDVGTLVAEKWPGVRIVAWDLGRDCCNEYDRRVRETGTVPELTCGPADFSSLPRRGTEGIILDYNLCTLRDLRNPASFPSILLRAAAARAPEWIEVTDSALSKLHLNYRCYGLDVADLPAYLTLFSAAVHSATGYAAVVAANHFLASYLRFEKARRPRVVRPTKI